MLSEGEQRALLRSCIPTGQACKRCGSAMVYCGDPRTLNVCCPECVVLSSLPRGEGTCSSRVKD